MIDNKFDIRDKVRITGLCVNGLVVAILVCEDGIQYRVRYFDNAQVKHEYFYDFELEWIGK